MSHIWNFALEMLSSTGLHGSYISTAWFLWRNSLTNEIFYPRWKRETNGDGIHQVYMRFQLLLRRAPLWRGSHLRWIGRPVILAD